MSFSNNPAPHQNTGSNTGPMVGAFSTSQIRYVEHMAFLEVISFFGEGVGAALYLLGFITDLFFVQMVGVVLVAVAVVALILHLGSRAHLAWRALARIRTSWVSRGSLFITLFMSFSVGSIFVRSVAPLVGFEFAALETGLSYMAVLTAPLVIIYAGMMLRSMKAVTLWRTFYLPVGFSLHSAASALLMLLLYVEITDSNLSGFTWLMPAIVVSLVLSALVMSAHLFAIPRSAGINASLELLLKGKFRSRMIWGAAGLGFLIPAACLFVVFVYGNQWSQSLVLVLLCLSVISRLLGDYAYRSAFVMSGAYEPIVPPASRSL